MKSPTAALLATFLVSAAACVRGGAAEGGQPAAPPESTLVGTVLLPSGSGSRGVEVRFTATGNGNRLTWVLFDEQGRFAETFRGGLTSVTVTAAAEVHRIDTADLPAADPAGQIDVGGIDLRDRLTEHRLVVRAADGKPAGPVRVGMWLGPPPVGPQGEPVSLGSRQFPPVELGSEMAWLLPNDCDSLYFLVERPTGSGRGREWRSGHQRLFGPFTSAEPPAELVMD